MRAGLAIAMLAALAGCDTPGNEATPQPQAKAIARTVLESEDSAKFRRAARALYATLGTSACADPTPQLQQERAALSAFEGRLGTTGAAFQLAVARGDAEYRQSCGSGDNLALARKKFAENLAVLRELLPRLDQVPVHEPIPAGSAEFRSLVRQLVNTVQPQCGLVLDAPNEVVLEPALEAVRQFQARLPGAVARHHYAIAKADVDLEQSTTMVECAGPSDDPAYKVRDATLADVRKQIAALEAIRL